MILSDFLHIFTTKLFIPVVCYQLYCTYAHSTAGTMHEYWSARTPHQPTLDIITP